MNQGTAPVLGRAVPSLDWATNGAHRRAYPVYTSQSFHARLQNMEVILRIPDDVAKRLSAAGIDVSRRALEALALEGYREQTLTLYQVSEMLVLSRVETEDFLGQHHVPRSEVDLDREAAIFETSSAATRSSRFAA